MMQSSPASLLGPNNLLSALLSVTLSLCYSLRVRDQVPQPHQETDAVLFSAQNTVRTATSGAN